MFKKLLKSFKIFPKNKKGKKNLFFLLGVLIILLVFFGIFEFYQVYQNKIYPRLAVDGIELGSLTKKEAAKILSEKVNTLETKRIIFKGEKVNIKASLAEMGIEVNQEETLSSVYQIGRSANCFKNFGVIAKNILLGFESPLYFRVEEEKIDNFIAQELESPEKAPQSAEVIYQNGHFEIIPPREGKGLDYPLLISQIIEIANSPDKNIVNLPPEINKEPEINREKAMEARDRGNQILEKVPNFSAGEKYWSTDRDIIASFLTFKKSFSTGNCNAENENFNTLFLEETGKKEFLDYIATSTGIYPERNFSENCLKVAFNKDAIRNYLNIVAPGVEQLAVNATLGFQDEKLVILTESQDQIKLNLEESIALIAKGLLAGDDLIKLAIDRKEAQISRETIGSLGLETLIGQGDSNFAGSPKNRRHNIAVGASKFNGTLIKPGETFSFLEILGPVDASTGYLPELVIKLDKTIPEYGGGMCQVSTTAFRGAVNCGFEITERVNHAYPVQYYSPQGTDATVYIPSPDLKFINNTQAHVLIQTKINGNILTFEFYGTNDGRRVETIGPIIYDRKSDGAMRSKWTQKVYRADGSLMLEKEFLSKYDSPSKYPHPGEEDEEDEDKKDKKKKKKD